MAQHKVATIKFLTIPYKSSLPSVSSRSELPVPAYSTMQYPSYSTLQYPSFAPVFSNKDSLNFTVNICLCSIINYTKDKDDVDCYKLLDSIQLEDLL